MCLADSGVKDRGTGTAKQHLHGDPLSKSTPRRMTESLTERSKPRTNISKQKKLRRRIGALADISPSQGFDIRHPTYDSIPVFK